MISQPIVANAAFVIYAVCGRVLACSRRVIFDSFPGLSSESLGAHHCKSSQYNTVNCYAVWKKNNLNMSESQNTLAMILPADSYILNSLGDRDPL
jgi:hypothetical protein